MKASLSTYEVQVPSPIKRLLREGPGDAGDTMAMSAKLRSWSTAVRRPSGPPPPPSPVDVACRSPRPVHLNRLLHLPACTRVPHCSVFTSWMMPECLTHRIACCEQEPYFVTKQAAARARPGDAAEVVGLRKRVAAMSKDFQSLLSTHERQEAAAIGLRQQVGRRRRGRGRSAVAAADGQPMPCAARSPPCARSPPQAADQPDCMMR